jgi:hypothetical protein
VRPAGSRWGLLGDDRLTRMNESGGRIRRPAARGVTRQHAGDILQEQERSNSAKRYFQDRVPISQCAVVRARSASKPRRLALSLSGCLRSWLTLFEDLKRLGGNEHRLGFSVLQQASNGIVKMLSYIRPLALLTLGNVFPSEAIGRIV